MAAIEPRVYSIATLLDISHDPEIKLISQQIKDKVKETAPEIVMNRKMKKSIEYHAIQERVRVKQEKREQHPQKRLPQQQHEAVISQPILDKLASQHPPQKQKTWQKKPNQTATGGKRTAGRVVEETNWRRLGVAAAV
jgi:hypothetical protein